MSEPHSFGNRRQAALFSVGALLIGMGLAILILSSWTALSGRLLSLWLPGLWLPGLLLTGVGLGALLWARPAVIVTEPATASPPKTEPPAVIPVVSGAPRHDGPRIVAIGGGTGMPQLFRGLRAYTDDITAIVTVADDGGSSGRLRRQMGMLPPGDFRNNIAALSDAEELMTRLFQYRFAETDVAADGGSELAGHSFGNLFITTMAAVTGSFENGIAASSRVLSVQGRVLPSTLEDVVLCAEIRRIEPDGNEEWLVVEGESNIPRSGGKIARVFLRPEQVRGYPAVIQAILQADLIVAGPGSFFTSVLPNLLVPSVRDAICAAAAPRIYLCNVATQPGETDGYNVSDHMRQLRYHAGAAFTTVLANDNYDVAKPPSAYGDWVTLPPVHEPIDYQLFSGDLVDEDAPWHHDPQKVAARLLEVYYELVRRPRWT